jgi:hypothetical protein
MFQRTRVELYVFDLAQEDGVDESEDDRVGEPVSCGVSVTITVSRWIGGHEGY